MYIHLMKGLDTEHNYRYAFTHTINHSSFQTVQPSRYCRDSTDLKACVPNPAYTLVGTTNVPRSACSSIHAARLNYNGRGDVSSARANAALGAINNVTRTVRTYIYMLRSHDG